MFAYISSKVHNHIAHYEPIKNINIDKETEQIKEFIDTEDLNCPETEGLYEMVVELYEKLLKANKILDSIKNS
ncbi:hypothetical protein CHF27_013660 [Romboutsia maritimum]|uniref:Uncharacterized protein n=1 Tax=Romboutsia maritimum TaxID=2020948 RepID=A0A371IPK7_9FIRM|nr:hypothetical protein [Romboutsia maritimum]RDY22402.1 hypothetical protein CHF27_013660 [Romboutsia maritimum]